MTKLLGIGFFLILSFFISACTPLDVATNVAGLAVSGSNKGTSKEQSDNVPSYLANDIRYANKKLVSNSDTEQTIVDRYGKPDDLISLDEKSQHRFIYISKLMLPIC